MQFGAGVWTFPVGAIGAVYNRVVLQTSFGAHRAPLQTEGRVVAPVYDRRGRRGSAWQRRPTESIER